MWHEPWWWPQRQSPKCWITKPFSHGWSPRTLRCIQSPWKLQMTSGNHPIDLIYLFIWIYVFLWKNYRKNRRVAALVSDGTPLKLPTSPPKMCTARSHFISRQLYDFSLEICVNFIFSGTVRVLHDWPQSQWWEDYQAVPQFHPPIIFSSIRCSTFICPQSHHIVSKWSHCRVPWSSALFTVSASFICHSLRSPQLFCFSALFTKARHLFLSWARWI
jgi:hypothetical protein